MTKARVNISWQSGEPPPELSEADLRKAVAGFLGALGHGDAGVNLLLADDKLLRELNTRYRGRAAPTDILSWSYLDDESEPGLLGEMALSLERGRAQARENGWDLRTEVLRLLAHGCAHLAGYDHESEAGEKEMREVEIGMLAAAGLKNLYPDGQP